MPREHYVPHANSAKFTHDEVSLSYFQLIHIAYRVYYADIIFSTCVQDPAWRYNVVCRLAKCHILLQLKKNKALYTTCAVHIEDCKGC